MKKLIININKWYDNLPEPNRTLFFFGFVGGSLLISLISLYVFNFIWAIPIWLLLNSWRVFYFWFGLNKIQKPRFYFTFKKLNKDYFSWKLDYRLVKELLWKDKFGTPRIELVPYLSIDWLGYNLIIERGSDESWSWWLWVVEYNDNDIEKAKETWPWYRDVEKKENPPHLRRVKEKTKPWENYE